MHKADIMIIWLLQAKRQVEFVEKMVDLGWAGGDRFTPDEAVLQLCIKQYHCFLDLMAQGPRNLLVPTLVGGPSYTSV